MLNWQPELSGKNPETSSLSADLMRGRKLGRVSEKFLLFGRKVAVAPGFDLAAASLGRCGRQGMQHISRRRTQLTPAEEDKSKLVIDSLR